MNSIKYLILTILFMVSIAGCREAEREKTGIPDKNTESKEDFKTGSTEREIVPGTIQTQNPDVPFKQDKSKLTDQDIPKVTDQRMIIKTGTVNLEADKYEEAERNLNLLIKNLGGYVSGSSVNQYQNGKKYGTIVLKVPVDKYDQLVTETGKLGKVISQNTKSSDVTEEYVDLESRLKTQKELEQRLIKLLNEKASRLAEIIEVEEKLASVRQKIESIEGRMKLLRSQADFSTLSVTISEQAFLETPTGGGFFYEIWQAVKKGFKGFTNVITVSITVLIALLPVIFLAFAVYYIARKIIRKRKQKTV